MLADTQCICLKCTPLSPVNASCRLFCLVKVHWKLSLLSNIHQNTKWMHYQHQSLFEIQGPWNYFNMCKVSIWCLACRSPIVDDHYLYYWSFSVCSECKVLCILLSVPHCCLHPPTSPHILLGKSVWGKLLKLFSKNPFKMLMFTWITEGSCYCSDSVGLVWGLRFFMSN